MVKKILSIHTIVGMLPLFIQAMEEQSIEEGKKKERYSPSFSDVRNLNIYIKNINHVITHLFKKEPDLHKCVNILETYICGPASFYTHIIDNKRNKNKVILLPLEVANLIIPYVATQEKLIYQSSGTAQKIAQSIAHACAKNPQMIDTFKKKLPSFIIKDIYRKIPSYKKISFHKFIGEEYFINRLTSHINDKFIIAATETQSLIGNIQTNTFKNIKSTESPITTIASTFAKIAIGCKDGSISILDREKNYEYILVGENSVEAIAFDTQEHTLVSRTNSDVTVWDLTQQKACSIDKEFHTHECASFSADGSILASPSIGGITLWDLTVKKKIHTFQDAWCLLALSPDACLLAALSHNKEVFIYTTQEPFTGTLLCKKPMSAATFCFNDGMLATGSHEGTLSLWSTETKQLITSLLHQPIMKKMICSYYGKILTCLTQEGKVMLYHMNNKSNEIEKNIHYQTEKH